MPFNGAGIFQRAYSWVVDAANGLDVDSTRVDADTNDIADGLSNCITRDGQSPATADIPLGGHKITGLAAGTAPTDAVNRQQAFNAPTFNGGITVNDGANVSGNVTFTNGTVDIDAATAVLVPTVDVSDNSTKAASTAYVNQKAFSSALPAQAGNATKFLTTDGSAAGWSSVSTFSNMVVMPASGTWTPPAGVVKAKVTVVAAGASGSTSGNQNAGGAAGGTAIKILAVNPAVTYTAIVGTGGAAVVTANTAGNPGGSSSFSGSGITTVSATGGAAAASGGAPALGGIGSNGDLNIRGGSGAGGVVNAGGQTAIGGASSLSGNAPPNADGNPYGGGAGGVYNSTVGKAGASGVVIIEY